MAGRAKGSDTELHIFRPDGRVDVVAMNSATFQPNIDSDRIQRCGTHESDPDKDHNGWNVEAEFDQESFALDDVIDADEENYYNGEPIERMELLQNKFIPALQATRPYRYPGATITDYSDEVSGQNDATTTSVTFETKRRKRADQ